MPTRLGHSSPAAASLSARLPPATMLPPRWTTPRVPLGQLRPLLQTYSSAQLAAARGLAGVAAIGSADSSSSSRVRRSRARTARQQTDATKPADTPSAAAAPAAAAAAAAASKARRTRSSKATAAPPPPPAAAAGSSDVAAKARQLLQQLQQYCSAYYAGNPLVPDGVYDSELSRFASLLGALRDGGQHSTAQELESSSPLKQVGAPVASVSGVVKVSHPTPMTSLAAKKDKAEVLKWGQNLANQGVINPEAVDWVVEPKVDGLAVRVVYRGGRLVLGATRGDGEVGEHVTHNMLSEGAVQGLPVRVPQAADGDSRAVLAEFEVRGEVYIRSADFETLNAKQRAAGQTPFANPRNAAAGSLRLQDPREAAGRHLSFLAYQLVVPQDKVALMPPTQSGGLELLEQLGFATTASVTAQALKHQARYKGLSAAVSACERWMEQRASVGFEVDGAVLKVDVLRLQAQLGGSADRDPKWAVAWKFPSQEVTTRVLGIEWSMGRSGVLTPVANLEPVQVGGVTVRHASLHNAGHLREMGLCPGDVVVVERAGDVIPKITGVLSKDAGTPAQQQQFQEPAHCPSCSSPLVFCEPAGATAKGTLHCENAVCPEQQLQKQVHFVDVCVKGIGKSTTQELWQRGFLNTPAGLYSVTKEDLLCLPKFGPRKADNTLAAIDASRGMDLATLLQGLGIEMIGRQLASQLAARYRSMKALQLAVSSCPPSTPEPSPSATTTHSSRRSSRRSSKRSPKETNSSSSSSSSSAADAWLDTLAGSSLRAWFASSDNKLLLNQLRQAGIRCCQEDPAAADAILSHPSDTAAAAAAAGGQAAAAAAAAAAAGGQAAAGGSSNSSSRHHVLKGLTVCVTGGIADPMYENREEFGKWVAELGGVFKNKLTRGTDVLVIGEKPSGKKSVPQGKRKQAAEYGTRVMSETEFLAEVADLLQPPEPEDD